MFLYLTSGTPELMTSLQKKYSKEHMIVLYGQESAVLLHESLKKSVFASPRSYEIIREINTLDERGFFVLNHIPVISESRKIFEDRFFERIQTIENEPGFVAFRLLRPLNDDVYISLSEWTGSHSFEAWKASKAYKDIYENEKPTEGVNRSNIFTSAPYAKTYISGHPEEDEL